MHKQKRRNTLNKTFDNSKEPRFVLCLEDILKVAGLVRPRRKDHDLQLNVTGNWKYFKI